MMMMMMIIVPNVPWAHFVPYTVLYNKYHLIISFTTLQIDFPIIFIL